MPPRTLLSSEQRTRLFAIPTDPAEMARHYVLDARRSGARPDKAARESTGSGFAVQLCAPSPSGPRLGPGGVTARADARLRRAADSAVDPALFGDYARRAETRREHVSNFKDFCGCGVSVSPTGGPACGSARMPHGPRIAANPSSRRCSPICGRTACCFPRRRCWSGLGWPRGHARERRPSSARGRADRRERDTLERLLAVDPELRRSRFAWLRDYSESPAPSNIVALLDRLEYARGLGIDPARAGRIHAARLARLIDEGAIMTVQHIADLEPARRTAILAVQAASLETRGSPSACRFEIGDVLDSHDHPPRRSTGRGGHVDIVRRARGPVLFSRDSLDDPAARQYV